MQPLLELMIATMPSGIQHITVHKIDHTNWFVRRLSRLSRLAGIRGLARVCRRWGRGRRRRLVRHLYNYSDEE